MNSNFISQSLMQSFRDSPLISDLLFQTDFTEVENKYSEILMSQFTNEEWTLLSLVLGSQVYQKFILAHNVAMEECSQEIAEILDLVSNFSDTVEH
ncbi:hypothetical protein D3C85_890700 [compost metagenome]